MRLSKIFLYKTPTNTTSNINHLYLPACVKCVHFIDNKPDNPYNPFQQPPQPLCKLFGYQDLVFGNIVHYTAQKCRNQQELCGNNATYFSHINKHNDNIFV